MVLSGRLNNALEFGSMEKTPVDWANYVEQTLALLEMETSPVMHSGVSEQFAQLAAIAAQVMTFPLPDSSQPPTGFEP